MDKFQGHSYRAIENQFQSINQYPTPLKVRLPPNLLELIYLEDRNR